MSDVCNSDKEVTEWDHEVSSWPNEEPWIGEVSSVDHVVGTSESLGCEYST